MQYSIKIYIDDDFIMSDKVMFLYEMNIFIVLWNLQYSMYIHLQQKSIHDKLPERPKTEIDNERA
jgi:hypothetical protein